MNDGSKTGCVVVAVMVAALGVIGVMAVVGVNTRQAAKTEQMVKEAQAAESVRRHEKAEARRLEARKAEEEKVEVLPEYVVQLKEEAWPPYERRKAGAPLSMEEFVASRIDETSTNLVKTIFRENSEGAAVRFQMKAIDVYKVRDQLQGDFAVEFAYWKTGEKKPQRGSVTVRCDFANTSANELLDIRRGTLVTVQGTYSMKTRRPMIMEAVLVRESGG